MENILLSIIIPVKEINRWENNIIKNIILFKKLNIKYEFLFVYSYPIDDSIIHLQRILNKEENIIFYIDNGKGIYSAMNKGIEYANGTFLIFIGADDSFNEKEVLNFEKSLVDNQKSELILFEVLFKGEREKRGLQNKEGGITSLIHWTLGQPRVHQGIVYNREFVLSKCIRYLTTLKVTSDYIFTSEVCSYNPLIIRKNFPILFYNKDGFSSKFSFTYKYLEHIKGFYLVKRLRKYLLFLIITRIMLILYKFIFILLKKVKLILK